MEQKPSFMSQTDFYFKIFQANKFIFSVWFGVFFLFVMLNAGAVQRKKTKVNVLFVLVGAITFVIL